MNNWICPKCSSSNAEGQNFCGSCGTKREEMQQSEPELQPTVLSGYVPQIPLTPNPPQPPKQNQPHFQNQNQQQNYQPQNQQPGQYQPNNYQAQQNSFPPNQQQTPSFQTPNFSPQFSASTSPAPKKSNLKLFVALGSVVAFIFVLIIGVVLWITVINPYLKEQAFIKKEKENQTRANATSPDSLLTADFSSGGNTYRRTQTFNKMQMMQASQYLPPEIKQGSENVTDAAAAEYINSTNSNIKVVLQIFKFNTPENAAAKCRQIGQEMEKRKDPSTTVYYRPSLEKKPNECLASATGKNNQSIRVYSLYGFLLASTGGNADAVAVSATPAFNKLSY
jgi:hypothetical protein